MAEGIVKKIIDKGFGLIQDGTGNEMFFHRSQIDGIRFEKLTEGQRVTYNAGVGPNGPRAENVKIV